MEINEFSAFPRGGDLISECDVGLGQAKPPEDALACLTCADQGVGRGLPSISWAGFVGRLDLDKQATSLAVIDPPFRRAT